MNGKAYTLVNLYAPKIKPLEFIRNVVKLAKEMLKGNLLLCGDFNMILSDDLDSSSVARRRRLNLGALCLEERLQTTERDYIYDFYGS